MAEDIFYQEAPQVEKIARETVIPQWHQHLTALPIFYVFAEKLPRRHGKAVLAKIKKLTPFERFQGGDKHDYVVMVSREFWPDLSEAQREAMVDHELSHIVRDPDAASGYGMRTHDIEEFTAVVERHGAWKSDVRNFLTATRNAQFDMFEPSHNGSAHAGVGGG